MIEQLWSYIFDRNRAYMQFATHGDILEIRIWPKSGIFMSRNTLRCSWSVCKMQIWPKSGIFRKTIHHFFEGRGGHLCWKFEYDRIRAYLLIGIFFALRVCCIQTLGGGGMIYNQNCAIQYRTKFFYSLNLIIYEKNKREKLCYDVFILFYASLLLFPTQCKKSR